MRQIDADVLKATFDERYDDAFMQSHTRPNIAYWEGYSAGVNWGRNTIADAPTVDAVEAVQFNTLKSLVNGEWVDCKLVQEALGIDFGTGLKMFDFSRTGEWNPAPLNGQKTTTKFRLKNTEVHGRWIEYKPFMQCSECGSHWYYTDNDCHLFDYCHNCGADMRERNTDEDN